MLFVAQALLGESQFHAKLMFSPLAVELILIQTALFEQ